MAPLTPFWSQPSHPDIQEVILPTNPEDFTTKSLSKISLPPYALFAKLDFPPCTKADRPTYATVQMGRDEHLNLNSDLVYINHSCEPSVTFDTSPTSLGIFAGSKGLKPGDELTFFYPSTEWDMAQGFNCFCGAKTCRGYISGAKNMSKEALDGLWLNAHIRTLLSERDASTSNSPPSTSEHSPNNLNNTSSQPPSTTTTSTSTSTSPPADATENALLFSLEQARKVVDAAQKALDIYKSLHATSDGSRANGSNGSNGEQEKEAEMRRGVTSREMSGEMGGDTVV